MNSLNRNLSRNLNRNFSHKLISKRRLRVTAECVTFAASLLVLVAVVALVIFVWVTENDQPPAFAVTGTENIRVQQSQFYVPFVVENIGGGTAESVEVVGELRMNDQIVEAGQQQIDFLSARETAEGEFVFSRDPRSGRLTVRVASYKLP